MEDYKNEIEMLRQAFSDGKTDEQIQMPDAEAELATFMDAHKKKFEQKPLVNFDRKPVRLTFMRKIAALFLGIVMLSGLAYATVRTHFFTRPWSGEPKTESVVVTDVRPSSLMIVPNDSVPQPSGTVTFDNHELADILTSICNAYKVDIVFKDEEQKHIRLHFSYDTKDKLEDVIESMNTFQKFRLELKDKKLNVE